MLNTERTCLPVPLARVSHSLAAASAGAVAGLRVERPESAGLVGYLALEEGPERVGLAAEGLASVVSWPFLSAPPYHTYLPFVSELTPHIP